MRSFVWLKRVGLSQVSKDWRLTFFSSAPRMRTQGLSTAAGVATKDIRLPLLRLAGKADSCQKSNTQVTPALWNGKRGGIAIGARMSLRTETMPKHCLVG